MKEWLEPVPDLDRPVILAKLAQRALQSADLEMLRAVRAYQKDQERKRQLLHKSYLTKKLHASSR